jgi:hypothetical protein
MGREATCMCEWNGEMARVKALIEPPELILRGEIRRRLPFSELRQLRTEGGALRFKYGNDAVTLKLEASMAERWAKAILTPPPNLARKLGITPESTVWMIGEIDDAALEKALAEARRVAHKGPAVVVDMIVARVNTAAEIARAFKTAAKGTSNGVPIWIVYRKGPGHAINESGVREMGLAAGIVDVKVASVSPVLTGLKFVRRKKPKRLLISSTDCGYGRARRASASCIIGKA